MINQMWSNKLFAKCGTWEDRFNAWFLELPLSERPMTSLEYIRANGPSSGDPTKHAAYDQFMRDAQTRRGELRERYMETVEPYPVKRFK